MSDTTIEINGMKYDATTGLPVNGRSQTPTVDAFASNKTRQSHEIHRRTQKSQTLNRHVVKSGAPVNQLARPRVTRSPMVSKFAPHPVKAPAKHRLMSDIGPSVHPLVKKTQQRLDVAAQAKVSAMKPAPAAAIKQEAIRTALERAPSHNAMRPAPKARRTPRSFGVVTAALALILLGGYFTYLNLPDLSVRVAAAQAGIHASYPAYRPDGYRMAGVTYTKGAVSIAFAANAGPHTFTITQQQSAWDSTAVKENYVQPKWGDDVIPYAERGLTIYAHDSNAVWVNRGILYSISGDAPLSSSQIRSIATNL